MVADLSYKIMGEGPWQTGDTEGRQGIEENDLEAFPLHFQVLCVGKKIADHQKGALKDSLGSSHNPDILTLFHSKCEWAHQERKVPLEQRRRK